jgi:hypothetical protein
VRASPNFYNGTDLLVCSTVPQQFYEQLWYFGGQGTVNLCLQASRRGLASSSPSMPSRS